MWIVFLEVDIFVVFQGLYYEDKMYKQFLVIYHNVFLEIILLSEIAIMWIKTALWKTTAPVMNSDKKPRIKLLIDVT